MGRHLAWTEGVVQARFKADWERERSVGEEVTVRPIVENPGLAMH